MAVAQGTYRPFYKTKSAWAEAMAAECRAEARRLRVFGRPADKDDPARAKSREASKYDRMATAFRKKGL